MPCKLKAICKESKPTIEQSSGLETLDWELPRKSFPFVY